MKVPVSWLKEYVDFDATAQELANSLTFSGIEVEGITRIGGWCDGVVAGEILSIERHPDADRLRLCRVKTGSGDLPVVCGADNFAVGDKVACACIGTTLPNGMKIRRAKIRGQVSEGMLCAEDELGLSSDHSGILVLPPGTPAGTPLADIVGPPDDVLELEITWNRADCLSIVGIAREVAALFGSSLRLPGVGFSEESTPVGAMAEVRVEPSELCPRYTARVLTDVKIGPSPMWMQKRLSMCGVRPISNVVDITNYILLECGHPLHAFDYDLLAGHRIVVRRAQTGEKMSTLDGAERVLTAEMLVIADGSGPVAVGGIMGGKGSEICPGTSRVLLESACFDPANIHATSCALDLGTESSHRFERGVDVGTVEWASRRATSLMADLASAKVAAGVIDTSPEPSRGPRIVCMFDHVRSTLGVDISGDEIVGILESLQIPVVERSAASCTVEAPTFRRDLEIEADLTEEVARIHGLDKIPAAEPVARIVPGVVDTEARSVESCRSALMGLGLCENMNYSFVSHRLLDMFRTDDRDDRVVLPNPVSVDHSVLRNSLIPQMVESLGRNLSRQVMTAPFFEIGKVFHRGQNGRTTENRNVCIGLMGKVGRSGLDMRRPVEPEEMFLWLKGVLERFLTAAHGQNVKFKSADHPCFEGGWAASVWFGDTRGGVLGLVNRAVRSEWRMSEPVGVAEITIEPLLGHVFAPAELGPIPQYPSVSRDMALIVSESVTHEQIVEIVRSAGQKHLTDIVLFDIFRAKGVGEGKKSLAYSLVYRSSEGTLTDEDANRYHEAIKDSLRNALEVEIREN